LQIDVLTIFPQIFESPFQAGLLKNAVEKGLIKLNVHNLRDFTQDKHRQVDDTPYGGGPGMVFKPEPVIRAIKEIKKKGSTSILLSPQGEPLNQKLVVDLSKEKQLFLICGRYEGVDERICSFVDRQISIGDYILSGGEIPALVLIEAISRLIPGAVKEKGSIVFDSFSEGLLDYSCYTRPAEFEGMKVPEILVSGDHKKVEQHRRRESLKKTLFRRPDLLPKANLKEEDRKVFNDILKK
jgi:tRNA (guanine37-N1)-methyltransferase